MKGVQLRADPLLPIDPVDVAKLSTPARGDVYRALDLHPVQIAAIEDAVRLVRRGEYLRGAK